MTASSVRYWQRMAETGYAHITLLPQLGILDLDLTGEPDMSETQPGLVSALSRDVFFGMRIRTVLKNLGYEMKLCKTEEELVDATPGAIMALVDFNIPVDWDALESVLKGEVPVLAFGSHTNVDGFRAAKAAGVTRVVSNGEFSRRLPALLTQYRRNGGEMAEE